jgi:hypothetical protein
MIIPKLHQHQGAPKGAHPKSPFFRCVASASPQPQLPKKLPNLTKVLNQKCKNPTKTISSQSS